MRPDNSLHANVVIFRSARSWLAWEADCVRRLREVGAEVSVNEVPVVRLADTKGVRRLAAKAARAENSALRPVPEPANLVRTTEPSGRDVVALALGPERECRQGAASVAAERGGVAWAFDLEMADGGATGAVLHAMMTRSPVVEIALVALAPSVDPAQVLHAGATRVTAKSFPRTVDAALWAAAGFPARVVREHPSARGDPPPSRALEPAAQFRRGRTGELSVFRFRCAVERFKDTLVWLTRHEQWGVGIVRRPIHAYLTEDSPAVEWLPRCERDRFVADSFAVRRDDTLTLVVEEYPQRTARGILSAFTWRDGDQPPARPTPVLELPVHLSYPYLVEEGDSLYCIPETSEAGEVALYRIDDSPGAPGWARVAALISGFPALDSTVFRHDGRWWLLAARQMPTQSLELHGWHSQALVGTWTPHTLNPLKCDIRSSRPAGTPFVHEGHLYRPAQDCSREYGGAVSICRIDRLTPNQFAETVVKSVSPDPRGPYPRGLHTISAVLGASDRMTVIDGKRRVFVPRLFVRSIAAQLARFGGRK